MCLLIFQCVSIVFSLFLRNSTEDKIKVLDLKIFDMNGRRVSQIKSMDRSHAAQISIKYNHNNKDVILDLKLNHDLIPMGHFMSHQDKNYNKIHKNLTKADVELCHYNGGIRGNKLSTAAASLCNNLQAFVFDGSESYKIESQGTEFLLKRLSFSGNKNSQDHGTSKRVKRSLDNKKLKLHSPMKSSSSSNYVELLMVVSNGVFNMHGKSLENIDGYVKDIVNLMNTWYTPLNIFIALVGVIVWTDEDQIEIGENPSQVLENFLKYRQTIIRDHPNDHALLVLSKKFDGRIVGKSRIFSFCTKDSGSIGAVDSENTEEIASTLAHEMGHNLGMIHDQDCNRGDDIGIMSFKATSVIPQHWSQCSIDALNYAFAHGLNYCLKNKPKNLIPPSTCGNGFVEAGEECDCGLPQFCTSKCCDPKTCKLFANASCANGECCDLDTCELVGAGTVCRPTKGECDLPEFCDGKFEYCPEDFYKMDTSSCLAGKSYCFDGKCANRDLQCKLLWGPYSYSMEICYESNKKGNITGNCGFDFESQTYLPCAEDDVMCGSLKCQKFDNVEPIFGANVRYSPFNVKDKNYKYYTCQSVTVDVGLESRDPGLAPNGATCGDSKICVDQKCVSLESLETNKRISQCPEDCHGNGFCNNLGHCHCHTDFDPQEFCYFPGPGGSIDSGPANPRGLNGFVVILLILVFGVFPSCTIFIFIMHYIEQGSLSTKINNYLKYFNVKISSENSSGSAESPDQQFLPRPINGGTPMLTNDGQPSTFPRRKKQLDLLKTAQMRNLVRNSQESILNMSEPSSSTTTASLASEASYRPKMNYLKSQGNTARNVDLSKDLPPVPIHRALTNIMKPKKFGNPDTGLAKGWSSNKSLPGTQNFQYDGKIVRKAPKIPGQNNLPIKTSNSNVSQLSQKFNCNETPQNLGSSPAFGGPSQGIIKSKSSENILNQFPIFLASNQNVQQNFKKFNSSNELRHHKL